jgi:hypothetical protein
VDAGIHLFTARTLDLHPAVAFAAVIAGAAVLGAVGALLRGPANELGSSTAARVVVGIENDQDSPVLARSGPSGTPIPAQVGQCSGPSGTH